MSGSFPPPVPPSLAALIAKPKHYLHISFQFNTPFTELKHLQEAIHNIVTTSAEDWMKYGGNCWIVWTRDSAKQWVERFNPIPAMRMNSILATEIELVASPVKFYGQFPSEIWEWLNRQRY
jgi:hypothetical protein